MTFLWNITRGATEFTPKEDKIMRWFLNLLIKECPKTCSFLLTMNLDKVKFYWAPNMTFSNGIMGAWCITSPNRIYIKAPEHISRSGYFKDVRTYYTTSSVFEPTIGVTFIHEFIHKLQFHTSPLLYVLNRFITLFIDRIPFLEQLGIEYDARVNSETEELNNFLKEFNDSVSSYFNATNGNPHSDMSNRLYKCWAGIDGCGSARSEKIKNLTIEYFNLLSLEI